jgi:hypothetical protein
MKAVYEALTGTEVAKLIVRQTANLVSGIPGLNSRLVTFPKIKATVTIRIEAFERESIERNELMEFTEKAIAEGLEALSPVIHTEEHESVVDETEHPPDQIREAIDLPTMQPQRLENGQIVDGNPGPVEDNLSNIVGPENENSPLGPHRGRVIEQPPLVDREQKEVGPKLKGDAAATTFRVRKPA